MRGAVQRIVSCSAVVEAPGNTQTSGGSPPKPPKQDKALGGGGQPEDPSKAQGWLQAAIHAGSAHPFVSFVVVVAVFLNGAAAFIDAVCGIIGWHASLATKADVTEAKNEVKDTVKEVQDTVKEVKDIVNKRMDDMEESLKFVVTWPYLVGSVAIFIFGRWGK